MAKSQESGTTILLGLKDYKVGEVRGGEEKTGILWLEKRRRILEKNATGVCTISKPFHTT
jgi:hypothetical protein